MDRSQCYHIHRCSSFHRLMCKHPFELSNFRTFLIQFCLFCLSFLRNVRIRRGAHWVVNLRYFDFFIMLIITMSSIALAAEDPVVEKSPRNEFLTYCDYAFTCVFTVEMLLKVVDLGIILHPGSYLREFWNIMDAVVVICAAVSFGFDML